MLIALSAFFNGSETSLTAASRARMHALEQEGNARAAVVNKLLQTPEKMIGTILIGNTLVDVLASALASGLAIVLIGEVGVAYATAIMTFLIVVFAAVLPKTYALAYSDDVALALAPIMRVVIIVMNPVTIAIEYIVRLLLKLTPSKLDDEANISPRTRRSAAPSSCRRSRARSPATMPTCSAACSTCAICRSPTSW
ncbi:MAG: CNNM domain-containing protein [Hyphomicrobium sp.]